MAAVDLQPARPATLQGFEPAGPPRLATLDTLTEVGRVFRGGIRGMFFGASAELLLLQESGVERVDANTLETIDRWALPGVSHWERLADGSFVWLARGATSWSLRRGAYGEEGQVITEGDEPVLRFAVTPDGATFVLPTATGVRVLAADGSERQRLEVPQSPFMRISALQSAEVAVSDDGRSCARWESMSDGPLWRDGEALKQPGSDQYLTGRRVRFHGAQILTERMRFDAAGTYLGPIDRKIAERLVLGAGRALSADGFGGFVELDPETFEEQGREEAEERHYGSMSSNDALLAFSDTHVASLAPTYGRLHVYGPQGRGVRDDHHEQLSDLQVARDGRRLVVSSAYRESGYVVDREAATCRLVRARAGMVGLGLSDAGDSLVLAAGSNGAPRTVHVVGLDADSITATHKSMAFARRTLGLAGGRYAHAAYNLNDKGWTGVFALGAERALFKIQEVPWNLAASADGATLAIVRSPREGLATLHDVAKKGVEKARLSGATEVALGSTGAVRAWLTRKPSTLHVQSPAGRFQHEFESSIRGRQTAALAFSEDESVLFHARGTDLVAIDVATGEVRRTFALGVGTESLCARGGLLYVLGSDGIVRAFGVPGEAPVVQEAPEPVEAETAPQQALPTNDGPAATLDLGGRVLAVRFVDGKARLFDGDKEVKSLRKRKTDDAAKFEVEKKRWAKLRKSLTEETATPSAD